MDELSEAFSAVMEFLPALDDERRHELVDSAIGTDPLLPSKNVAIQTNHKCHAETQTEIHMKMAKLTAVEERKLATWLREIYPAVLTELSNPTPTLDTDIDDQLTNLSEELKIETYQKLSVSGSGEHTQGVATWLSVHTNDAPVLVLTAIPVGTDDWNEAVNQCLKVYQPKRIQAGNYVVYTEVASVPVKVVKSLCTNSFNKSIFAGSSLDGDIYVWQYEFKHRTTSNDDSVTIKELHCVTSTQGLAVVMDWANEHCLLTAHANGWIVQWHVGEQPTMIVDWHYQLKATVNTAVLSNEISSMVCLSINEFVVGTKDGGVYHCWSASGMLGMGTGMGMSKTQFEIVPLRKHHFMISTLLKTSLAGCVVVISCDLSGEVYYHDLRHADDDDNGNNRRANVIAQIPLPFKNAIACSRDALVLYAPGNDGALECYRIKDGQHTSVKGALRGKGNFIKCSDNGHWIITGLYEDEFQIFYADCET